MRLVLPVGSTLRGKLFDLAWKRFAQFHSRVALHFAESVLLREIGLHSKQTLSHEAEEVLYVRGWITPDTSFRKFLEQVRSLNPDWNVQVRREYRKDLGLRSQLTSVRVGFVFSFRSTSNESRVEIPGLSRKVGLKYSTPLAEKHAVSVIKGSGQFSDFAGIGYIDSTWVINLYSSRGSQAKIFERFVLPRIDQILEILKFIESAESRDRIASRFSSERFSTEISDRFRLALSTTEQSQFFRGSLELKAICQDFDWRSTSTPVPSLSSENKGLVTAVTGSDRVQAPMASARILSKVNLQAGSTIFDSKILHVVESAADPRQLFVSGQWDHVFGWPWKSSALIRPFVNSHLEIEKGALLSGRNDANWYHWIIEYLPRLHAYEKLPTDIPLVVSAGMPRNFMRPLELLTNRKVISVDRERTATFDELWVAPPVVQVLDSSHVKFKSGLVVNSDCLRGLRSQLTDKIQPVGPSKIFLKRNSEHRGLINQDEVQAAFERLGFTAVEVSSLTFDEQVSVFSAADVIVGAGGAVMANYLFAKPKAKIIALASQASAGFYLPAVIADVAGAEFSYFFGKTAKNVRSFDSRLAWMHSDFVINASAATRAVQSLIT